MNEVTHTLALMRVIPINEEQLISWIRISVTGPDCIDWRRCYAERAVRKIGSGFGVEDGWFYEGVGV